MKNTYLTILGLLICSNFAFAAAAPAGDDYEPETILECGGNTIYGSAPRLKVDLTIFEEFGMNAVLMSYTTFAENGTSTIVGCRVTEVHASPGVLEFSNPQQNCEAKFEYSNTIGKGTLTIKGQPPLENCDVSNDSHILVQKIKDFDQLLLLK